MPFITVYYGPGRNKPVVKTTHGRNFDEALPNVARHMTRNDYGAIVAEVTDAETAELLLVATYKMGEKFNVAFQAVKGHPICVMTS